MEPAMLQRLFDVPSQRPPATAMPLSELLPTIQSLPRADKLRLIQILAEDVARDEGVVLDWAGKSVPIWSPHDAFEGAATLLNILSRDTVRESLDAYSLGTWC
jgi:hypothetical protein